MGDRITIFILILLVRIQKQLQDAIAVNGDIGFAFI
jgi:hypothetical protein